MIKDNVVYFGYGTVGVGVDSFSFNMTFQEIKPPVPIGESVFNYDVEFIGEKKVIEFKDYKECVAFGALLQAVEDKIMPVIVANEGDLILDFSHYDEGSVKVVKEALDIIRRNFLRLMAC